MAQKTRAPKFHEAADVAKEPIGSYATARELLNDLPAIIKQCYGVDGVNIASHMLRYQNGRWCRSNREWFDRRVAFAVNALRNPDLAPDLRAHFESIALIGRAIDAAERKQALSGDSYTLIVRPRRARQRRHTANKPRLP